MKLFEPVTVNKMTLQNRVVYPAVVSRLASIEGFVTRELKNRVLRIAKGGVGMIVLEPAGIIARKSGNLLKIHDDKYISGLKELVSEVHKNSGAKIGIQLIHFLKISRSGYRQTLEDLSITEIKQITEDFYSAAERIKTAGFDFIELHCAHAYTLSSFLSLRNKRRDAYGNNMEGRMRLISEVCTAVNKAVGHDYTIGCRINGDEFILGGNTLKQSCVIAERLVQTGVHYISVSAGGKFEDGLIYDGIAWPYSGYSGARAMPPAYMPEGVNVYLAEAIRNVVRSYQVPVIAAGKIQTPVYAESLLKEGKADLVALGRPLICDPDWPVKVENGRSGEIVLCKYCGGCTDNDRNFEPVVCRQWPKGSLDAPVNFKA